MTFKEILKPEKFNAIFRSEIFRDGFPFFVGTLLICLYFQASGMLYEGFAGYSIWIGTPLTFFKVIYTQIIQAKIVQDGIYSVLIVSAFIPIAYCCGMFLSYKLARWKGVEVTAIFTGVVLVWLMLADTLFNFAMNRHVILGDPFNIFRYWWFDHKDGAIHKDIVMAFFMAGLPVAVFLIWFLGRGRNKEIYGDAHFATYAEIQRIGLFKKEGVYLGKAYHRELHKDGYEHLILFAPTGGFKTTSETIPNLFRWQGSCVCTDIKLTLFNLTSLYRQSIGQLVYLWNPAAEDGLTHCYNPLDYISRDPLKCVDDIQRIAYILIPKNPHVKDPFWETQARQLLIALIHYVLGSPKHLKTLGEVNRLAKSYADFDDWINEVLDNEEIHYICRNSLHGFLDTAEITRKSVKDTMLSHLAIFDNPYIEASTSRSDFDLRNLRKTPMTIYIGVPENSLDRLSPLISIFYEQLIHLMTDEVPDKAKEPHDILLLMDEFGRLRRMESFMSITTFREYRIRIFIILQEIAQIYAKYGQYDSKVFLNAKIRMAYTPNDMDTCKYLESCLGNKTIKIKNESRRLNVDLFKNADISENTQTISRPLMLAQEIRELPADKAIIMVEGSDPVYADKIPWFKDKFSSSKLQGKITVPDISELVKGLFDRATRIANELQDAKNQEKEKIKNLKLKNEAANQNKAESESAAAEGNHDILSKNEEIKSKYSEPLEKDKKQDKLLCIVID